MAKGAYSEKVSASWMRLPAIQNVNESFAKLCYKRSVYTQIYSSTTLLIHFRPVSHDFLVKIWSKLAKTDPFFSLRQGNMTPHCCQCHPNSTMLQNMALASISTSSSVRLREVAFRSVPLRATYYSAKNRSLCHSVHLAGPFSYKTFF